MSRNYLDKLQTNEMNRTLGAAARSRRLASRTVGAALFVCAIIIAAVLVTWGCYQGQEASPPTVDAEETIPEYNGKAKTETNSIGMRLVLVPAGEFSMGNSHTVEEETAFLKQYAPERTAVSLRSEYPHHEVRINRMFWIGAHHVTRGQFREFVAETGYRTDAETDAEDPGAWGADVSKGVFGGDQRGHCWKKVGFPQGDDHPVVNISWNDAKAFCAWLGKKEGERYRLPTEAEWEYACRGGTRTRFWCGEQGDTLFKVANVADAELNKVFSDLVYRPNRSDGYAFTSPVGTFAANPFGLFDMHGNATQWCEDKWRVYNENAIVDPIGTLTESHMTRGGSWRLLHIHCRCAERGVPVSPDSRSDDLGFRVLREIPDAPRKGKAKGTRSPPQSCKNALALPSKRFFRAG